VSTTAPQPYRHHTRLPEWVNPATSGKPGAKRSYLGVDELAFRGARTTSPAARALTAEWPLTNTAHRDEVRGWTQTEPALRGLGSGGEILDAIDIAPGARKDELLLALLRLSQSGERFATRTLLQAMMPKLSQLAHYAHICCRFAAKINQLVYVNPIKKAAEPPRLIASLVRFTPGARTNWPSHAHG